ncbi:IPT/TIG domain-containing protein [Legionella quateirensis]|uniref:Protein with a bacterial immunoglobulin-like domain n=1 Tax=Legionella quateirensis TaxID=45072 RepID=A0A378KWJ2_9GAMM|nr:IPT/TIG domain-containing protein [Legionella quateirensis]KTD46279.1 protein with a bacterial immunoglobulin-like domain protein [Legionella quateirensis]STY18952.1 protein with a bacterial immunoglobulin-like domain [Legionella quateirensis]
MKIKFLAGRLFSMIIAIFIMATVHAGKPLWTFSPLTPTRLSVPTNTNAWIQYRVTNQSMKPHILVMTPIRGITQIVQGAGLCGTVFALSAKDSSCILSLQINGNLLTENISTGPVVCEQGHYTTCYTPSAENSLRIDPAPPLTDAAISVLDSPLSLTANGATGSLTIRNNSIWVKATNITSNFTNTALDGKVFETGNNCNSVEPLATCTLTFTAATTPVVQTNFSIQGTNTAPVRAAMSIVSVAPTLVSITPNAGTSLGNTAVTLTGTNFTNSSTVTFDGVSASNIVVINETTLTADTPAHAAGAVDVVVTTAAGSDTLTNGYTYLAIPTLSTINPVSGTAIGNTGVTLTGTHFMGTISVTFDGIPATSVHVVNNNAVTAVTPAHAAGPVNVVITTPDGSAVLNNGFNYRNAAIGQASGGGKIGFLGGGLNNMIVANVDNSSSAIFGGFGVLTNATSTTNGASNTTTIVSVYSNPPNNYPQVQYAAGICSLYEVDSQGNTPCQAGNTCYNDWFLPALNQLNCFFTNKVAIGGFNAGTDYWTSTEINNQRAWYQWFGAGTQSNVNKNTIRPIRCARNF